MGKGVGGLSEENEEIKKYKLEVNTVVMGI